MRSWRETSVYITLNLLVFFTCADVLNASVIASENSSTKSSLESVEKRLDIKYNETVFREIEPDVLNVVGDITHVILTCEPTWKSNSSIFVNWIYHGIGEKDVGLQFLQNMVWLSNFSSSPPVARMECVARRHTSISNNTLIYRGNGIPPFLHNNGQTVPITVLNDTSARLPCLLNYPLDNLDQFQLQLFKDGVQLENKNNCLSYTPELGYILNLTKLEKPFGNYECRVVGSADNDFVRMELQNADVIRAKITVKHSNGLSRFYHEDPQKRVFICSVPKSTFENRFQWYFLLSNGTYVELTPQKSNLSIVQNPDRYFDSVKFHFPRENVTHVVCAAYLTDHVTRFNNTYAVDVTDAIEPEIVNAPSDKPIFYEKDSNLTCAGLGDPINFTWLKNGKPVVGLNTKSWFTNPVRRSVLFLNPSVDDVESNYTCVVENFKGEANFSFRVQLKDEPPSTVLRITLITLGICLAAGTIILLLLFTFFQVKFERRRFSDEKIRRFLQGIGPKEIPYNEFGSQEPFESVSYDTSKEINLNSLNFVRELKGGNFGKVQLGYYLNADTNTNSSVAIKSIKDDPNASDEDIEFAFVNFLKEIKIMQILGEHPNVVKYIGAVTSDLSQYSAYLVVEYCCEGDLKTYLRTLTRQGGSFHDDVQGLYNNLGNEYEGMGIMGSMKGVVLKTSHLMKWAEHCASGLEYIASKNLVHRDIACRNVLLAYQGNHCNHPDPDQLIAKISDFGLSKDLKEFPTDYYAIIIDTYKHNRPLELPLRWISVETLETLKFTTESDVWSFGVTLWEMFTLCNSLPYQELADVGDLKQTLIDHLRQGNVLSQPELAPDNMWSIMLQCWNEVPDRPDFRSLKEMLHAMNENRRNQLEVQRQPVIVPPSGYSSVTFVANLDTPDSEFGDNSDNESVQYDE